LHKARRGISCRAAPLFWPEARGRARPPHVEAQKRRTGLSRPLSPRGRTEPKDAQAADCRFSEWKDRSGTHRACWGRWVPLDVDWSARRSPRQRRFQRYTPFRGMVQPYPPLRCPPLGNSAKHSRLRRKMPGTTARTQRRFTRPAGSRPCHAPSGNEALAGRTTRSTDLSRSLAKRVSSQVVAVHLVANVALSPPSSSCELRSRAHLLRCGGP